MNQTSCKATYDFVEKLKNYLQLSNSNLKHDSSLGLTHITVLCPKHCRNQYDHVLGYGYTVWTNSEKNISLYFWGQEPMWCVLLKAIVPKPMIQAKKMLPDA